VSPTSATLKERQASKPPKVIPMLEATNTQSVNTPKEAPRRSVTSGSAWGEQVAESERGERDTELLEHDEIGTELGPSVGATELKSDVGTVELK
jgi:hypothetical protein